MFAQKSCFWASLAELTGEEGQKERLGQRKTEKNVIPGLYRGSIKVYVGLASRVLRFELG